MVFLKLLGHALGSVVMDWGLLLLCIAPGFLGVLVLMLVNQVWNKLTGQRLAWAWPLARLAWVGNLLSRIKFARIDICGGGGLLLALHSCVGSQPGAWMYFVVGGASLSAYFILPKEIRIAAWLSASWLRVFVPLLAELIRSL